MNISHTLIIISIILSNTDWQQKKVNKKVKNIYIFILKNMDLTKKTATTTVIFSRVYIGLILKLKHAHLITICK